jgi:hypothetical protein
MPRPTFPHTLADVTRALDGPMGLIVGDLPDGRIFVLKRGRKEPGYTLTGWSDAARSRRLSEQQVAERAAAIAAFCEAIGLQEG